MPLEGSQLITLIPLNLNYQSGCVRSLENYTTIVQKAQQPFLTVTGCWHIQKTSFREVSGKARIYPLGIKDQKIRYLVDDTFDELHKQNWLEWTMTNTPFSYPVFVVWRNQLDRQRKG